MKAKSLSPRHRRIALLLSQGLPQKTVAERTGYCADTICRLAQRPEIQRLVDEHLGREAQAVLARSLAALDL